MQQTQANRMVGEIERIVLERIASDRLVVPAMPAAAARCLAILKDTDFQIKKLVAQLETDPVLAAKVLKAANAAAHGPPVRLLDQAVGRLGSQRMKTLVIEYASNQLFQSSDKRIADANRRIWEHSIAVAVLARDLAAFANVADGETCYLGGLLHDVGKPVLAAMLLEVERRIGATKTGWIDPTAWVEAVEASHRKVGLAVATTWHLPDEVITVIRDYNDYDANQRTSPTNVVRLANAFAKREGYVTGKIDAEDVEAMVMVGRSMLGIDEDVLTRLAGGLKARIAQATGL